MNGMRSCPKHAELRDHRYPGRFCIYCGEEIVRVESHDGQLALVWRSDDRVSRYVAVVYEEKQYAVRQAEWDPEGVLRLVLEGRTGTFRVRPQALLQAFQEPSEVLRELEYAPG